MATWREMALENRAVAKDLHLRGKYRSSMSRAYYAAYCVVTSFLAGNVTFGYGGNNPTHNELPTFVVNHLGGKTQDERHRLRKAIGNLFKLRTDADYVPAAAIGKDEAKEALRDMASVFRILQIEDEKN